MLPKSGSVFFGTPHAGRADLLDPVFQAACQGRRDL
jgi:hypothetical protein